MITKLPNELISRIIYKLEINEIHNVICSSNVLNKMNFQALLIPQLFKQDYFYERQDILDLKNSGFTMFDYIEDLLYVIDSTKYSYETRHKRYIVKKMCRFNHNQTNLYEKKEITEVKIHPIYRIPLTSYVILKNIRKSNIFALIY